MESDRVKFAVQVIHGKVSCESVIQSISFYNQRLVGHSVHEDWSGSECFFEKFKSGVAFQSEIPRSTSPCESG